MSLPRPPATRVSDKVMIPQDEYPEINFVGLLIGPRWALGGMGGPLRITPGGWGGRGEPQDHPWGDGGGGGTPQ